MQGVGTAEKKKTRLGKPSGPPPSTHPAPKSSLVPAPQPTQFGISLPPTGTPAPNRPTAGRAAPPPSAQIGANASPSPDFQNVPVRRKPVGYTGLAGHLEPASSRSVPDLRSSPNLLGESVVRRPQDLQSGIARPEHFKQRSVAGLLHPSREEIANAPRKAGRHLQPPIRIQFSTQAQPYLSPDRFPKQKVQQPVQPPQVIPSQKPQRSADLQRNHPPEAGLVTDTPFQKTVDQDSDEAISPVAWETRDGNHGIYDPYYPPKDQTSSIGTDQLGDNNGYEMSLLGYHEPYDQASYTDTYHRYGVQSNQNTSYQEVYQPKKQSDSSMEGAIGKHHGFSYDVIEGAESETLGFPKESREEDQESGCCEDCENCDWGCFSCCNCCDEKIEESNDEESSCWCW
ncbi:hypothetical protein CC80DRAFT_547949 [Byssothecium circinans]|uniref:Uncharacterized protein n=1 Tax=Byssothecium circinans TaxID=147558 RepID=A0A6A5U044_9PLEO|nr:hypothetical protein CC80DRAFT_547949 [Byssothecium circinans]